MSEPVAIGLGGNLGDDAAIVARFAAARAAIAAYGEVRSAPLYRSAPIGPAQPAYLNTAIALELDELDALFATLRALEDRHGRDRAAEPRWGPRTLDLDVLVWGGRVVHTPVLEVPHPRLVERRFALEPVIALLGADLVVPGHGRAGELLARVADQRVELIAARW